MVRAMQRAFCGVLALTLFASSVPLPLYAQTEEPVLSVEDLTSSTTPEIVPEHILLPPEPESLQNIVPPLGTLLPGETLLLGMSDESVDMEWNRDVHFGRYFLEPMPVYTASASGAVTKVRMYLARNPVGIGNTQITLGLRADAEHGYVGCTLLQAAQETSIPAIEENFAKIPVGDAQDVALIEFTSPEGNCTVQEGLSYTIEFAYDGYDFSQSLMLYTKGSGGTNFFIEVIGGTPIDPPLCTENCYPNVLFLHGIQGSALKEGEDTRWPSSLFSQDVSRLALSSIGDSVNDVQVAGVIAEFVPGVDIYGGFNSFMNERVADGTINEWTAYAYDWRLPLTETLEQGSEQVPDGQVVRLVEEIERLAAASRSGKVAIITHSMGGLLGKLLIQRLEQEGKADLVESFVMVGTPQLGTPQAVASLLHGHQHISMDLFSRSYVTREIAQNMQTPYDLLPSERYFEEVTDSVVRFNQTADFTQSWIQRWGTSTDAYGEFVEFVTGQGVTRIDPQVTNLAAPELIRPDLYARAETLHSNLDSYVFPLHIRVVQIAGWGLPTLKGIEYKKKHIFFDGYDVDFTTEGDGTVVYPSAIAAENEEKYYFNIPTYNALESRENHEHRNLTSARPILSVLESVIKSTSVPGDYITTIKPDPGSLEDRLLVSTKSPVILGAYDQQGNFTGINPNQDITVETLSIEQSIPGSTFLAAGEDLYLFLPKSGSYTFVFKGTGNGPATVEVGTFADDMVTLDASYTDIPVTLTTTGTFFIAATSTDTFITIDQNGDGQTDSTVAPDGYVPPPTLAQLIKSLKAQIQALNTKPKLKEKLLNKVEKLEKKIAKNKTQKVSKVLIKIGNKITQRAGKGKISESEAEELLKLLKQIEDTL